MEPQLAHALAKMRVGPMFDWNDLRYFLAVARNGSLGNAAASSASTNRRSSAGCRRWKRRWAARSQYVSGRLSPDRPRVRSCWRIRESRPASPLLQRQDRHAGSRRHRSGQTDQPCHRRAAHHQFRPSRSISFPLRRDRDRAHYGAARSRSLQRRSRHRDTWLRVPRTVHWSAGRSTTCMRDYR